MQKKWPWFLDMHNEKYIWFFFKYLLGYGALIGSIGCLLAAIFPETELHEERIYWAIGFLYLMMTGIGIVLHKEWSRKLIIAFPFVVIILCIATLVVP